MKWEILEIDFRGLFIVGLYKLVKLWYSQSRYSIKNGVIIINLSIPGILMVIPGIIIAVTLHEYAKSLVAYRMGDVNVKKLGRLAPNPLKHMDILGGIFLVIFGYGWSSPVRLTPFLFKNRKKAMLLIFVIPFLVNIIVGVAFAIAASIFAVNMLGMADIFGQQAAEYIWRILSFVAIYNISFALFSLIPIYPLNGIHLLAAIKPTWNIKISQYEKILQLALAFFIILTFARQVFEPVVHMMLRAISL